MRETPDSTAAPAARRRNCRRGSFMAPASFLIMARLNLSVWLARPIKKQLHLSEQLHPILLHHDKIGRFPHLAEPPLRAAPGVGGEYFLALPWGPPNPP